MKPRCAVERQAQGVLERSGLQSQLLVKLVHKLMKDQAGAAGGGRLAETVSGAAAGADHDSDEGLYHQKWGQLLGVLVEHAKQARQTVESLERSGHGMLQPQQLYTFDVRELWG
jgi:hypothetical protein